MINRVILTGRLTKEVELSYTPSGVASAKFTLAVNRAFANQSGEREADFINIQAWRKTAESAANFLNKGSMVGVDGKLQSGSYEKDGKRVYFTNVVADSVQFLEPKNGQANQNNGTTGQPNDHQRSRSEYQQPQTTQQNYTRVDDDPFANSGGPVEVTDDDLPF